MASVPNSGAAPPLPVWDAQPPETAARYAGFWLRVVAAIVDGIALWILWWIVQAILPSQPLPPLPANPDVEGLVQYLESLATPREGIVYALLVWAYSAFQESSSAQATLCKLLFGVRVSTESGARLG